MKPVKLFICIAAAAALCLSCDDGVLVVDQTTSSVGFENPSLEIEQSSDAMVPLVIRASKGSIFAYKVYVKVEDPEAWIGDVCTISNPVYKAADHENGDHAVIYTANMGEGMLQTALLLTAGVHSSEDIRRSLTFEIIPDPLKASYPDGNLYYKAGKDASMEVILKQMEP